MEELKITDNAPEVLKFKKERTQKRESLKKEIRKSMLEKSFSENQTKDFFDTIYEPNGLIKKKYLSPLCTSLILKDQQEALKTELENIQNESNRYIQEGENQIKFVKRIAQLRKMQIFDKESIDKLEEILYSQGPSKLVMEKINKMIEDSRYVDSLIKLIIRKEPSLKKYINNIKAFILGAEVEFRKKYKNTLAFNNVDLGTLKNASSARELVAALPNLLK